MCEIDIHNEHLMQLSEAADWLPRHRGKKIHLSTLWRWAKRGVQGVRLETIRIGGRTYTSREALQRFAIRRTVQPTPTDNEPQTPRSRQRRQEQARRRVEQILGSDRKAKP